MIKSKKVGTGRELGDHFINHLTLQMGGGAEREELSKATQASRPAPGPAP